MTLIVDASIAAAWVLQLPDEQNGDANAVLIRLNATGALIPVLFWFEALNFCLLAERRQRIRSGEALIAIADIRQLNLRVQELSDDASVVLLALKHNLSAYDAAYLALAVEHQLPLATADRRLATAARAEQIEISGPLGNKL